MKPALYQDFVPHMLIFLQKCISIMKLSNPPSFRAIRALIASQSTFEICDPVQQKGHDVGQVYSEIMDKTVCKI